MIDWDKYAKHPSVVLVLGDVGSGKTSIAAMLIDHYHRKGLKVYMVGKPDDYPEWVTNANLEKSIPQESAILVDDAHLSFYARDWAKSKGKSLDFIARERRHGRHSVIYTTQQGRVLDVNLISMASCLVFRRPSLLQLSMERPEIQQLFEQANEALETEHYNLDYAYIVCGRSSELVNVGKPPGWFTDELSTSNMNIKEKEYIEDFRKNKLYKIIAGMGRFA